MRKFLKVILIAVAVLVGIGIISTLAKEFRLCRQGFDKEERAMIRDIEFQQSMVNSAVGRSSPKEWSFTHAVEVRDDDGTLLGYSMDGKMEGSVFAKRYFFTKTRELLWWSNVSDSVDVEGARHLSTGTGF